MSTLKLSLGVLLFCARAIAANTRPFEQFYPEYNAEFTAIIANNCSSVFHQYLNTSGSPFETFEACHQRSVFLGLLPTILALLGSTTPELSLLSSRRPLLAFLLSIGAPAVSPVRTFMYHDPVTALNAGRSKPIRYTKFQTILIVLLEYLAVGAAVANVWSVSWQLGYKTILNISCGNTWFEVAWLGLATVVHLGGTLTFATRSKTTYPGEKEEGASFFQSMRAWVQRWPRNEFSPCATHTTHILSWKKENYWFLLLSWCVSVLTVAHIIYGTAVLSSITFIGLTDALPVAARYMASVLMCRMIVAYELRGMRAAVLAVKEEGELGHLTNDTSNPASKAITSVKKG